MKIIKKALLFCLVGFISFTLTGCGEKEIEGKLEDLMNNLYADVETPMGLQNMVPEADQIEYYIGTKDIKYDEILVSESQVGSIAHSVVLIRLKDGEDIETAKTKIKENVKADKWICVQAEKVTVKSKGHLIMLVMSSEDQATKIEANFDNLK